MTAAPAHRRPDRLLVNARVATMAGARGYGLIEDAAVAIADGRISYCGPRAGLPDPLPDGLATDDLGGALVTPGLIDCHTHLIHAGNRAGEFEERLNGVSYSEIARRGGGIMASVRATRAASEADLLASARDRLAALAAEGVTTVEVKSGYGLDTASELKMLRVAKSLADDGLADIVPTFLGAHALPPEFAADRAGYLDLIVEEMLPAVAGEGLAAAVDGFCETIAFSVEEMARVFAAARALGLPVKLHAEQLSNLGGARMAAGMGALSADHLEYLDDAGVAAMAEAGTVAVLLPGAFYYLRERRAPPVEALRLAGVPIAVATDLNPGSSPLHSLLAAMNIACVLFTLTAEEALRGVTVNAARALGLDDRGILSAGKRADLAVWRVESPGELAYPLGLNPCRGIMRAGAWRHKAATAEGGRA